MEEKRVLREKVYETKPIKELTIGDEWYLQDLDEDGVKAHSNLDNLTVYKYRPRCCKVCKIAVREIEEQFGGLDGWYKSTEIQIASASDENKVAVYLSGKYYKDTVKEEKGLGCDTASFSVYADGRSMEFNTLADGYYGDFSKYKEYYGFSIHLYLDEDAYSYDEVLGMVEALFPPKK